jgi:hypothetical protein
LRDRQSIGRAKKVAEISAISPRRGNGAQADGELLADLLSVVHCTLIMESREPPRTFFVLL